MTLGRYLFLAMYVGLFLPTSISVAQPLLGPGIDPSAMSGIPRQDAQVPSGTLVVRVIQGDFQHSIDGFRVDLIADTNTKKPLFCTTQESGRCEFSGLESGHYQVRAAMGHKVILSEPIAIDATQRYGWRVLLVFQPDHPSEKEKNTIIPDENKTSKQISEARKHLYIGEETRLLIDFQSDDIIQISEEIFLHNPLPFAIDAGSEGLAIPLPQNAKLPRLFLPIEPSVSLVESNLQSRPTVLWKGTISPGTHMIRVAFLLQRKDVFLFEQFSTLTWQSPTIIMSYHTSVTIHGNSFEQAMPIVDPTGVRYLLATAKRDIKEGELLSFTVSLHHQTNIPQLAGILSGIVLIICFCYWIVQTKRSADSNKSKQDRELLDRREQLLSQLTIIDAHPNEAQNQTRAHRDDILKELVQIYHTLEQDGHE